MEFLKRFPETTGGVLGRDHCSLKPVRGPSFRRGQPLPERWVLQAPVLRLVQGQDEGAHRAAPALAGGRKHCPRVARDLSRLRLSASRAQAAAEPRAWGGHSLPCLAQPGGARPGFGSHSWSGVCVLLQLWVWDGPPGQGGGPHAGPARELVTTIPGLKGVCVPVI